MHQPHRENEVNESSDYYKRLDKIRKGELEDERPSYAELTAWITSMKKPNNIKGILRRIGCVSRSLGVSLAESIACVEYGHQVIGSENSFLRNDEPTTQETSQ